MDNSDLYPTLIDLKKDLIGIREDFGDPRLRKLTFELPQGLTDIEPKLVVTTVPDKMIGMPLDPENNFVVSAQDMYVKNIARSYDRDYFNYRVWLDAHVVDDKVLSGTPCRVHVVQDKSGLSYHLILRKEFES